MAAALFGEICCNAGKISIFEIDYCCGRQIVRQPHEDHAEIRRVRQGLVVVGDLAELRAANLSRHDLDRRRRQLKLHDGSDLLLAARTDPLLAPALFVIVTEDTSRRFTKVPAPRGRAVLHKPVSPVKARRGHGGTSTMRRMHSGAEAALLELSGRSSHRSQLSILAAHFRDGRGAKQGAEIGSPKKNAKGTRERNS